jgi:DNA-binding SARP family transcriptional activator
LAGAVFEGLPSALQRFLQVTAVPIAFSPDLATHLLDGADGEVAAQLATVQRRNLFLSQGSQPGTYRYHDLFRDFLLAQGAAAEQRHIAARTVTFLEENDCYAQAVEQALESQLHTQAARLLLDLKWDYVHDNNRYRTFDRWVMSLDPAVRDAHPALYWMAGHCLIYLPDREQEAFDYFERSEALALEEGDRDTVYAARYEHAHLRYMLHGASNDLTRELARIAEQAPRGQKSGLRARRTLSALLAELGRFRQAQATWHAAYQQAQELGFNEMLLEMMKRQYALYMLTPLGAYAQAREIFLSTIEHTAGSPGNQLEVLVNYCDLLLPMGAWEEMARTRQRIDDLAAQVEDVASYLRLWLHFYDGMLALAGGRLQQAEAHFTAMSSMGSDDEDGLEQVCQGLGRIWLARQRGELQAIAALRAEIDQLKSSAPYHVAWAHLEADIALGLAAVESGEPFAVAAESLQLYHFRARGDLLRLRVLLTVLCHAQGQRRWRRMARITLRELQQAYYEQLLTRRDAELGAQFWRVLLVEGLAVEQAISALAECALVEPLLPLLAHPTPRVRAQSAQVLAQIGDERAMGSLSEAIAAEKDRATRRALEVALAQLETAPPPPLRIELIGGFVVRRGEQLIEEFHRPIVARLLQYFAVHRGRPLARDLILQALWPGTEPEKAWRTFRTVYSRLRNTLEPHMRNKGPNRYFALDGESYTFDPHGFVTVDVEQFRQALDANLPPEQRAALLQRYGPVLPELGAVDWLLELRAQMQELYVTACLRLGEQLLARGDAAAAQQWAQRVIDTAPWLEAAYQLLMRAYARQNLRSRALRTYEEACVALQAELAVDPSPLTAWLYTRLQAGESI